jgi:hypothetical protein
MYQKTLLRCCWVWHVLHGGDRSEHVWISRSIGFPIDHLSDGDSIYTSKNLYENLGGLPWKYVRGLPWIFFGNFVGRQVRSPPSVATCACVCIYIPLGQKSLEMAHEPRGVCFKLWVKKSCSCFLHSPRSHVGDVLWNSEPDSRRQFSHCFWSAFLVFRKMRFRTESAKTYDPKHNPEGSSFWPYGCRGTDSKNQMGGHSWNSPR